MRFSALAFLLLLTGCSGSSLLPGWMGGDTSDTTTTSSNAGSVAVPADELGSCQEQARAMIKRDEAIDQDINNQNPYTDLQQGLGDLNRNLSQYNNQNRYARIVEDCMAARGYDVQNPNVKPVMVEQPGNPAAASAPTSQAAPPAPDVVPAQPSAINPSLPTYP